MLRTAVHNTGFSCNSSAARGDVAGTAFYRCTPLSASSSPAETCGFSRVSRAIATYSALARIRPDPNQLSAESVVPQIARS